MSADRDHASNGHREPAADERAGSSAIQPMFLLADSQLLFWGDRGELFLRRARACFPGDRPLKAAYLGASNGDVRDYFDLFVAAMEGIDVTDCRMVLTVPSDRDRAFLDEADLVMLAGGDAELGFRAFQAAGLVERIIARYAAGAVLMGVSAGAIHLGQRVYGRAPAPSFEALRLAPCVVGAHDEPDWPDLARVVAAMEGTGRGIGIPFGGGAIVHADLTIEPVRKALTEISVVDGELRRALLMPPGDTRDPPPEES